MSRVASRHSRSLATKCDTTEGFKFSSHFNSAGERIRCYDIRMPQSDYSALQGFKNFEDVADLRHFSEVDDTWSVIISDIQGSTAAIEAGRYKEVNLIGAATIVAIRNCIEQKDFPFVFGGDGATVLLPAETCLELHEPLMRLQKMAQNEFQFELRIAIIPVSEIRARGGLILLSKFRMTSSATLAMIQGGGLRIADQLAKGPEGEKFRLHFENVENLAAPDLSSLSCRWAPFQNRNGVILSVLVQAKDPSQASEVYREVLKGIHPIFENETNRPVAQENYRTGSLIKSLWRERKIKKSMKLKAFLIEVVIPTLYIRLIKIFPQLPAADQFREYLTDTIKNSDYKKLDDTLRMVLDCTPEQETRLGKFLEKFRVAGTINYGCHRSASALMTCVMEGMNADQHIHFVDGSDGGYAMAAKIMKAQL